MIRIRIYQREILIELIRKIEKKTKKKMIMHLKASSQCLLFKGICNICLIGEEVYQKEFSAPNNNHEIDELNINLLIQEKDGLLPLLQSYVPLGPVQGISLENQ